MSLKKREALSILTAILGAAILAFGTYNIHAQSGISEGGILGLILLIKHHFDISPAISGFVLDAICYAIGFYFLGKSFAKYAIIATVAYSVVYRILESFTPLLPSLADSPVVAAVLGGVLVGVGVGMVVRMGGACGGDDALAMTINKLTGINIGLAYVFTDFTVLALSLTYIPFSRIQYSIITVVVSSGMVALVQRGKKITIEKS